MRMFSQSNWLKIISFAKQQNCSGLDVICRALVNVDDVMI